MGLNGSLEIGRSGLIASQTAMQVVGNNLANAATEGFSRRRVDLLPRADEQGYGRQYVGRGVEVGSIQRVVDTALLARFRDSVSEQSASQATQGFLEQIESLQNELSENDLSTLLSEFFNSWSEVANNPDDGATRAVVLQQGVAISSRIGDLREDYSVLRDQVDNQIENTVSEINDIVGRLGTINFEIAQLEVEAGEASALRDQRDTLINQLSEYFEVDVFEGPNGSVNVVVNSLPIVLGADAPGIELRREVEDGDISVSLAVAERGFEFTPTTGTLGALLESRTNGIDQAIADLESLATALISEVNNLHASGQPNVSVPFWQGQTVLQDTSANFNLADAGLPSRVENGSFMIHVTHEASGQRVAHRIDVDGDTDSLDDLAVSINAVLGIPNMNAGIDAQRRVFLQADPGYSISFSDDTSGALAALGINTFFTGDSATTMNVREDMLDKPALLSVGSDHVGGTNGTALAIARLEREPIEALGDLSMREYWQNTVNGLAVQTGQARSASETASLVRESLYAQMQSISGVSVDEETINLLSYQRQFQAAARFIDVIDQSLQELLRLV